MLQVEYIHACIHTAGPDPPLYSLGCHWLRIHLTSWLRSTWLHWSRICNKVALAWLLRLWPAAPTVCGGQWSCLVEDSEAVEDSWLWRTADCGGQWSFQLHDIFYRCMIYTIVYTIVYIMVYTMIYMMICIMAYTMIYMHVYALLIYTVISGAR